MSETPTPDPTPRMTVPQVESMLLEKQSQLKKWENAVDKAIDMLSVQRIMISKIEVVLKDAYKEEAAEKVRIALAEVRAAAEIVKKKKNRRKFGK